MADETSPVTMKEGSAEPANMGAVAVVTDDASTAIKTMNLYTHLDRIDRELRDAGLILSVDNDDDSSTKEQGPPPPKLLTATDLSPFDSMHYQGNDAIRAAVSATRLTATSHVLDIGAGLGGPARLLAHWVPGCRVDALELQADLHACGSRLTRACRLEGVVRHVCGDILVVPSSTTTATTVDDEKDPWEATSYDAIVSWLVFLHIADAQALFAQCWSRLAPGGRMYVEDFCRVSDGSNIGSFTDRERDLLANEVFVQHVLPTWEQTKNLLEARGFLVVEKEFKTDAWRDHVHERALDYKAKMHRHEHIHGVKSAQALLKFYHAIDEVFSGGRLGGVAYTVERPIETL